MTWLVERLAELVRHLEHLEALSGRVDGPQALERDLSLHNDVLYSLLTVCQIVIDVSGELSARRGRRFEDYTEAVRNLAAYEEFPEALDLFGLRAEARGKGWDIYEAWKERRRRAETATEDELDDERRRIRKRRRRRRRPRKRRRK